MIDSGEHGDFLSSHTTPHFSVDAPRSVYVRNSDIQESADELPLSSTRTPALLRVLSCNLLAGGCVQGYRHYITRCLSGFLLTAAKEQHLRTLGQMCGAFDVVGLQEVDTGSLRSGFRNQTYLLARTSNLPYWCYQTNRTIGSLACTANAFLGRYPVSEATGHGLPGNPGRRSSGRGVLVANVFVPGDETPWTVAVTHLSLSRNLRERQMDFLSELLGARSRLVLMGDFNTCLDTPGARRLFQRTSLTLPGEEPATFPSWRPRRNIDHILISDDLRMTNLRTMPAMASDHLPLVADIGVRE